MPTRADRHLRAIQLAQDCHKLGARARTIHHVTSLPPRDLQRFFFTDPKATPRGRAPDSPEWYHGVNLLFRAESSIFVCVYRRLRDGGFAAAEALVGAYRHYQTMCQCPYRISFDRAFDLASHTDGIWLAKSSAFSIVTCSACGCEFLAAAGTVTSTNDNCPFCKLVRRRATDHRVQSAFPTQPLGDPTAIQLQIMALVCPSHADIGADVDRPEQ
jgi:hypothetical protein